MDIHGVLISGDIAFSARAEQYDIAERSLSGLLHGVAADPTTSCYLVPGNHDVDWRSIGPADAHIFRNLQNEEQIARILAHPATMELLSARLATFYSFTERLLGKARGWRRDRPWRVEFRDVAGWHIAVIQLNTAWTLGPDRLQPLIGEFQVQEALTEAGDVDLRLWLLHHPFTALSRDEAKRIIDLINRQRGADLVLRGARHAQLSDLVTTSLSSHYVELASGPLFPGPIPPLCSIVVIAPRTETVWFEFFRFDDHTRRWRRTPSGEDADATAVTLSLSRFSAGPPGELILPQRASTGASPSPIEGSDSEHVPKRVPKIRRPRRLAIQSVTEAQIREALAGNRVVLVLTAVETELGAALDYLKPLPGKARVLKGHVGQETYFVGRFGTAVSVVTMCGMGTTGRDSVILAAQQAVSDFKPIAIVMVGIAFGKDPTRQRLGDVLVASQVVSYEPQRVGEKRVVYRGPIALAGPILLNRFRQALDWKGPSNGEEARFQVGPLLSGEKVIDKKGYRDALFESFPQAIGGEMEGAGVYAVAARAGIEWLVVKAICDWADGEKNDDAQPRAARAAASLVHHVLSEPTVLDAVRV
jgi:nucleoside phosphorylase